MLIKKLSYKLYNLKLNLTQVLVVSVFFLAYFILGYNLVRSYNTYVDEPRLNINGLQTYNYVFNGDDALLKNDKEKYYGPLLEFSFVFLEKTFQIKDLYQINLLRHFSIFCVFYLGCIFFYLVLKKRLRNTYLALLGTLLLIMWPRIFADSFYNARDIPLLAFMVISIWTLENYLEKKTKRALVMHAVATALVLCIRLVGVFIPLITLGFIVAEGVRTKRFPKQDLLFFAGYSMLTYAIFVALTPILWTDTLTNTGLMFSRMAQYPKIKDFPFFGQIMSSTNIPWYYVLGWILIATPVSYFILIIVTVVTLLRTKLVTRLDIIFSCYFFIPLSSVILLSSTLYNGMRHLFFIIPQLCYFAILAIYLAKKRLRFFLLGLLIMDLLFTAQFMIRYHPYQHLYFNLFAGPRAQIPYRFETDYWGMSYKQAFEEIANMDARKDIYVAVFSNSWAKNTLSIMPDDVSGRIIPTERQYATDYEVILYRSSEPVPQNKTLVKTIEVDGIPILGIYKTLPKL